MTSKTPGTSNLEARYGKISGLAGETVSKKRLKACHIILLARQPLISIIESVACTDLPVNAIQCLRGPFPSITIHLRLDQCLHA